MTAKKTTKSKSITKAKSNKSETKLKAPEFKTPPGDKKAFDQLLGDAVFGVPKTKTGK